MGVRRLPGLLLIAAAVAGCFAPIPATWVERGYSRAVYLRWQHVATTASNAVPMALFDVMLLGGIALSLAWGAQSLRSAPQGRRLRAAARLGWQTSVTAAAICLWFLASWGLNYRRVPLTEQLAFDRARVTPPEVEAFALAAVDRANALARAGTPHGSVASLADGFRDIQHALGISHPAIAGRPKPTLLTWYFRAAVIDGMTDPFFLEILINGDVLPVERPFVIAHEWAHLAGFADESEASFVAWLVCRRADAAAQYSGALEALMLGASALEGPARGRVFARLGPGPRADLAETRARLSRGRPAVREAARATYDRYLKANRVKAGVRSYGLAIELMVGARLELRRR